MSSFIGAFATGEAPDADTITVGYYYFDTTLGTPLWSDGSVWVGAEPGDPAPDATGATAGIPGTWTPEGAEPLASVAALQAADPEIVADPLTLWTEGQYIQTATSGAPGRAYWNSEAWVLGEAPPPLQLTVGFTAVPGQTFAPWVGLTEDTPISWHNSVGTQLATGPTPSFTVPGNGIINMVVDDEAFVDFLNFGYDNTQDVGNVSLPPTFNWPPTSLTGVTTPMTDLTQLRYFMAADTALTGFLDISGHPHLEHIECFHAHVETCDLAGCDALVRLCFETNDLDELDLTDVRTTLVDLRCADQGGATSVEITCTGDLEVLNHYCAQGNAGGSDIPLDQMPALREWWVWDKGLTTLPGGAMPVSPYLSSIRGDGNPWSEETVEELFETLGVLAAGITDTAIATVNRQGFIQGDEAADTPESVNGARALLSSREWSFTDYGATGDETSDGVWPDNTKDGTADGWARITGPTIPVAVYNGKLTAAWSGYNRIIRAAAASGSPTNPTFTVTADRTSFNGTNWGMFCRADSSGVNGARALINGATGAITGIGRSDTASSGNASVTTLASVPAGWTNAGSHTMSMTLSGNQITVALDGTNCYRATPSPTSGSWSGHHFGFCGSSTYVSRTWDDFTLTG